MKACETPSFIDAIREDDTCNLAFGSALLVIALLVVVIPL